MPQHTYHFHGTASYDFCISVEADTEDAARAELADVVRDASYDPTLDIHGCDVELDTGDPA